MSRKFAKSEIIRQKCSICGSKNKLYTEIIYSGIHYGYMLTCCNCGHVDIFMKENTDPSGILGSIYHKGKEQCIQLTTCHNKECRYYGKSSLWDGNMNDDGDDSSSKSGCCDGCGCNPNRNPIEIELDINKSDKEKFH